MKDCNLEYKRVNVKLHELVHEINRFCVCEIKRKGKNVIDLKEGPPML